MRHRKYVRLFTAITTVLATAAFAGCDDDPAGPDPIDPAGLEVLEGETVIIEVDGLAVTGRILVDEGADTGTLTFRLLDEDGDPLAPGASYELELELDDESVATFEADATNSFAGVFSGVAVGTTTFVVRLIEGENEVWESPDLEVTVQ